LNNAAKYTDDGGNISLALRAEADDAVITVKDDGAGIPSDKLEQIFELFAQIGHGPGRTQSGLGIGLTLVKRLAEMHGGRIEVRSEGPGKGSEFTLRLPLAKISRHPTEVTANGEDTEVLAPRRILVVDDNRDAAESLAMLLSVLGAEVHIAYSGEMALRMLDAIHPNALLLDIGMPGMDGYEVARRVRADPSLRDIKLIALTGWGQEEDRKRSEGAGFDYHLIKPANVSGLETLFRTLEKRVEQQPTEPRH
jgi:CheY-like chemotaxis protein